MRYSSGGILGYAVLTLALQINGHAEAGVSCKDIQGRSYENGFHYIPGPKPCTLCVCDNGNPKWCKVVICTSPQESLPREDCKSFRFGNTCCEFICMDDTLSSVANDKPDGNGTNMVESNTSFDFGLRLLASCITALVSLSILFFFIHRMRQRKIRDCVAGRQSRQLAEDQRSLGSMGYMERSSLHHGVPMDDMPCGGGYPLWKPPSNYFPRGEPPPPYEEAVAAAHAEQSLLSVSPHGLSPLSLTSNYLSSRNSHPSVAIVANSEGPLTASSPTLSNTNASTSPLISISTRPLSSPATHSNCYQLQAESSSPALYPGTSTTSFTIGTNTYENLPNPALQINQHCQPQNTNLLMLPVNNSLGYQQHHTTLPRQSGAFTISATLPNSTIATHRSIPRLLTTNSLRLRRDFNTHQSVVPLFDPKCPSPGPSPKSAPPTVPTREDNVARRSAFYEDFRRLKHPGCGQPSSSQINSSRPLEKLSTTVCTFKPPLVSANEVNDEGSFDSATCTCSMQALPTLHDDADDYRSECENCKSAHGSRYYLDNEDELVTSPHETMTLQRRPEDAASSVTPQYYRTSLTLPTSTRQRTRNAGNRGNWFSSMPESSTESSDDE